MAESLGEAILQLRADASQLKKDFTTAEQQSTDRVKKAGKGMAMAGAGLSLALTAPIIGFGKVAFQELNETRGVLAQTEARIKSTGGGANVSADQVRKLAEDLQKLSGTDDAVVQAGANMMLTFRNVKNAAGEGNDIFNQATKAALDLSHAGFGSMSDTSKQLGKALNDPIQGMSALSRSGVTFSQAQKKQIKAMVESGDVLGAQKLMLKEVESQVGGAAKAAGKEFPAKWANFTDSLAGAGAEIMESLLPAFESLVDVGTKLAAKFGSLPQPVLLIIGVLAALAAVVGPILVVVGTLTVAVGALAAMFGVAASAVLLTVGLIVAAIVAAVIVVVLIVKYWDEIKAATVAVWNAIVDALKTAWNAIKSGVASAWAWIKNFISKHAVLIATVVMGPLGGLVVWAVRNWDKIKAGARNGWNAIKATIGSVVSGLPEFIRGKLSTLATKLGDAGAKAGKALADAIKKAINGVITFWNDNNDFKFGGVKVKGKTVVPGFSGGLPDIKKLAAGGIAFGPTLAQIGEYSGARSNPEVVAPLDKLRDIIGGVGGSPMTMNFYGDVDPFRTSRDVREAILGRLGGAHA